MPAKTVVIHQPDFLPYLGFFHRLILADLYVVLDNVQFVNSSRSWHNRDKIKTPHGEKWLTVSVKKAPRDTAINAILLSDTVDWRKKNLSLITQHYKKAPFFQEIFPYLKELYGVQSQTLVDFNMQSIRILLDLFGTTIKMKLASELDPVGKSNELLIDILKKVDASQYLSGLGARDYYDPEPFEKAGIKVAFQEFTHPVYPQMYGEFIPYLSAVDLLFNCGIEQSRKILRSI